MGSYKKIRQSNIELLRIVLMMMIIAHHFIVHGLGLAKVNSPDYLVLNSTYLQVVLNSFLVIAVNCFVFISGYFGINFKLKTVFKLILQAVGYSVFFYMFFFIIGDAKFAFNTFARSFFPISNSVWWFISVYIGLYLIAPFLNSGMNIIDKKMIVMILLALFFFNSFSGYAFGGLSRKGYSFFSFIFIYLLGRFLNKGNFKFKEPLVVLLSSTTFLAVIAVILLYFGKKEFVWNLFYYSNPLVIISAIALFFVFDRIKMKFCKTLNTLASFTLGVYMIHEFHLVRHRLMSFYGMYDNSLIILPLLVVVVFLLCSGIECLRNMLFSPIIDKLFHCLSRDIFHRFYTRIIKNTFNFFFTQSSNHD